MVAPAKRFAKKVTKKSPGGRKVTIYKTDKPNHATCALCKGKLQAVPKRSVSGMRALAKTEKRPERGFGGVLCSNCTRSILVQKTRLNSGTLSRADIDFT